MAYNYKAVFTVTIPDKEIKIMKKKLIAYLLCGAALVNLVGCSNTDTTVESTPSPETTLAETTQAAVETEETEATETEETEATETTEPMALTPDEDGDFFHGFEQFEVTSEDINDGVWADVIAATLEGENVSPELTWEPVEGADQYIIYMVDTTAYYFIHWKSEGSTETHIDQGWGGSSYGGPYPPEGNPHTYDVYVIALRAPLDRMRGTLGISNPNFPQFLAACDVDADGNTGNIIAYGRISGTYTNE